MNEAITKINELTNLLTDDEYLKLYEKLKERKNEIEKQQRLNEIDNKFKEKGITCSECKSYYCVKNGHDADGKQKYLCKTCRASFDAFRNHFTYRSRLSYKQWNLLIQISMLGQSSKVTSRFIKTSLKTAWYNRQKLMKSNQLEQTQLKFEKLSGRIQMDETFIKEIHKGNFKNEKDLRKKHITPNAIDKNCCIEIATDSQENIYVQATNTKCLQKEWVKNNLTKELIAENSTITCDMNPLYQLVAQQTNSNLEAIKTSANKEASYRLLDKVSKLQSNLKESLVHYHCIGFSNMQNYLNFWKWKYQHKGVSWIVKIKGYPKNKITLLKYYFNSSVDDFFMPIKSYLQN